MRIDFIGVGAPKCGSTWFFYGLGQHPGICLSEPKEINYFNSTRLWAPEARQRSDGSDVNPNRARSIQWYARHFGHCPPDSLRGEFSPNYLYDKDAARLIYEHYPDVKLLVSFRNPADMVYSTYWARRAYRKVESIESFEKALEADPIYLERGYFARHLQRFLDYFPRERLKIVLLDDIVARPEDTLRAVFRFLELDPDVPLDLASIPKNKAKRSWMLPLEPLMKKVSALLIERDQARLLNLIRRLGVKKAALRLTTIERSYPAMQAETRSYLAEVFRADVEKLETILERDLSSWK